MSFTEANTVDEMILDTVAACGGSEPVIMREDSTRSNRFLGGKFHPLQWNYVPGPDLPRKSADVMVATLLQQ